MIRSSADSSSLFEQAALDEGPAAVGDWSKSHLQFCRFGGLLAGFGLCIRVSTVRYHGKVTQRPYTKGEVASTSNLSDDVESMNPAGDFRVSRVTAALMFGNSKDSMESHSRF